MTNITASKTRYTALTIALLICLLLGACTPTSTAPPSVEPSQYIGADVLASAEPITTEPSSDAPSDNTATSLTIPDYTGEPYVIINDNEPFFADTDYAEESFERYSNLGQLPTTEVVGLS